MSLDTLPFALAHHMSILPLVWLGVLAYYRQSRSATWWALALVLSVSWIADTVAHWVDPWLVSTTYPLVQALVWAFVLLPSPALWRFVAALAVTAGIAVALDGIGRPDVFVRTVAWTGLVILAWPHRQLRAPMAVTFGVGWLAWIAYSIAPGWATWVAYQGVRAVGLGVFCWATAPQLARAR